MDLLKKEHDEWLATKPESITDEEYAALVEDHKSSSCPYCNENKVIENIDPEEGGDMSQTITLEDHQSAIDAAVASAVAPLEEKIATLEGASEQTAVELAVSERTAELASRIDSLQTDLDASVLEAEAAKTELANVISYLESVREEKELAEIAEWVKAVRLEEIAKVASFPEDYLAKNLSRFIDMSEDEFNSYVEDLSLISSANKDESKKDDAGVEIESASLEPVLESRKIEGGESSIKDSFATLRAARSKKINIGLIR